MRYDPFAPEAQRARDAPLELYLLLNQPDPLWLVGINLSGVDLSFAELRQANLKGPDLSGADLSTTAVAGAFYDDNTIWPDGFDPQAAGALLLGTGPQDAAADEGTEAPAATQTT